MTFTDFESFVEFVHETDGVYIQETSFPGDKQKWLTIENIEDSSPLLLAEVLISAHDSGFYFGTFNAERYGGTLTIYE